MGLVRSHQEFLVRGLQRALREGPALQLAEDFAQDAMLHITRDLGQFRSDRFTTWALAIAIRVEFNEVRPKPLERRVAR
jgi:DNA-directed RNA polymerase specialized sigma24 family protein